MRITERDNGRQSAFVKTQVSKGFFSLHLKTRLALQYAYSEGGQLSMSTVTGYLWCEICKYAIRPLKVLYILIPIRMTTTW